MTRFFQVCQVCYREKLKTKKCGVELFAILSSTVNRFWKFLHCGKQQWIICKINLIFCHFQKSRCTVWNITV